MKHDGEHTPVLFNILGKEGYYSKQGGLTDDPENAAIFCSAESAADYAERKGMEVVPA